VADSAVSDGARGTVPIGPVEVRVPPDPALSQVLRLAAGGMATLAGFTIDEIEKIKVAVSEVLIALIEHGGGAPIDVHLDVDGRLFIVRAPDECRSVRSGAPRPSAVANGAGRRGRRARHRHRRRPSSHLGRRGRTNAGMNSDVLSFEAEEQWLRQALRRYAMSRDQVLRDEIAARADWLVTRSVRRSPTAANRSTISRKRHASGC